MSGDGGARCWIMSSLTPGYGSPTSRRDLTPEEAHAEDGQTRFQLQLLHSWPGLGGKLPSPIFSA